MEKSGGWDRSSLPDLTPLTTLYQLLRLYSFETDVKMAFRK
jgi:hypothetical protein